MRLTPRSDIPGIHLNGLLQWLDMRLERKRHLHGETEIQVTMEVVNIEPGPQIKSAPLNGGSIRLSEKTSESSPQAKSGIAGLIRGILEHELDEGMIVNGRRRWDPHAYDYDTVDGYTRRPYGVGKVVRSRDLFSHAGGIIRAELRPLRSFDPEDDPSRPIKMTHVQPEFPAGGVVGLQRPPLSYVERPYHPREYDEQRRGVRRRTPVAEPEFSFEGTLALLCPRVYFRTAYEHAWADPWENPHLCTIEVDLLVPHPDPSSNLWQEITLSYGCDDTPGSGEFAEGVRSCVHGLVNHVLESCLVFVDDEVRQISAQLQRDSEAWIPPFLPRSQQAQADSQDVHEV